MTLLLFIRSFPVRAVVFPKAGFPKGGFLDGLKFLNHAADERKEEP
jgi:hypothetical protein